MSDRRTVLITGASGGIGAETARRFSAAGYAVAVHYHRGEAAARALADELNGRGGEAAVFRADVADSAQVDAMISAVLAQFGRLDALVCCAGVAWQGLLTDMTDADWAALRGVDLDGVLYCCRAVIPHFVRQKAGRIIAVSSMWGQVGASCEAAYSAAKAGVIGLVKALAKELGPSGITVNCVAPGVIDTPMNRRLTAEDLEVLRLEAPLERIGSPGDAAESILFLASDAARFITGQVLSPNGGMVV